MIAKVMPKGKSFRTLIKTIFEADISIQIEMIEDSGDLEIPLDREDLVTIKRMIEDFENQPKSHEDYHRDKTYVGYHILAFSQAEMLQLDGEEIRIMVKKYILDMGLNDTQYIAVSHRTEERFYVHLVFNRCMNNRRIYKDWQEKKRASRLAVELSHNLESSSI